MIDQIIVCRKCKKEKTTKDFYPAELLKKSKCCRSCLYTEVRACRAKNPERYKKNREAYQRNNAFRAKLLRMNLSDSFYAETLEKQNGKCAICKAEKYDRLGRRFAIDHCHDTGKIRGLLCSQCNVALGMFKDSEEVLENAIKYLRQYPS